MFSFKGMLESKLSTLQSYKKISELTEWVQKFFYRIEVEAKLGVVDFVLKSKDSYKLI